MADARLRGARPGPRGRARSRRWRRRRIAPIVVLAGARVLVAGFGDFRRRTAVGGGPAASRGGAGRVALGTAGWRAERVLDGSRTGGHQARPGLVVLPGAGGLEPGGVRGPGRPEPGGVRGRCSGARGVQRGTCAGGPRRDVRGPCSGGRVLCGAGAVRGAKSHRKGRGGSVPGCPRYLGCGEECSPRSWPLNATIRKRHPEGELGGAQPGVAGSGSPGAGRRCRSRVPVAARSLGTGRRVVVAGWRWPGAARAVLQPARAQLSARWNPCGSAGARVGVPKVTPWAMPKSEGGAGGATNVRRFGSGRGYAALWRGSSLCL